MMKLKRFLIGVKRLPDVLSKKDKAILLALLLTIGSCGFFWWKTATSGWLVKPVKGGIYTEGIIGQNPREIDLITAKLTKIGLTYTDTENKINGALASNWTISEDGKKYSFTLRDGVNAGEVVDIYTNLPSWKNITVETVDPKTIVMTLKQPFAPLLTFTSEPVVDMGPYIKEKETSSALTFLANKSFVLGEPNIQRIILLLYPDERALKAALQRQEIMGADRPIRGISGTSIKSLDSTKQSVLIFNLEKPALQDKELRRRLRDADKLDNKMELKLVTTQEPHLLDLANAYKEKMAPHGLTVNINSVNSLVLDRDIVPNDDYDLMLADLNYGYDGDPYPYWHSSQLIPPGQNYAGYNSKEADQLIEQARQTLNDKERDEKHKAVRKLLETDIVGIFYPSYKFSYTVSKRLHGVKEGIGALPSDRFTGVWQWFLKAKKQPN